MGTRGERARQLFCAGYNCSQAVVAAFCDLLQMDEKTALKLSSSFGGGMGRLREVCGAVSGMFMVAGLLYGYTDPKDNAAKKEHYALIQELARRFSEQNGSIVCRELLGLGAGHGGPTPTVRNAAFYKKRPCADLVADAADLMEYMIRQRAK